jgi:hypothetical protein
MNRQRFPGFTAESSLRQSASRYIDLPGGSSSFDGSRIEPAVTLTDEQIRQSMNATSSVVVLQRLQSILLRRQQNALCKRNCYSNCIRKWPDYPSECQGVAESCCTYDYHCYYCEA